MIELNDIPLTMAHVGNFNPDTRNTRDIKFIVMHYTSNINDTAVNNVRYYNSTLLKTSAHYFVRDSDIQQSVPLIHAAYAVGLGSMKAPYAGTNPKYYKICTNSNSVSIEMCGDKNRREASAKTKETACRLAVALLKRFNLTPSAVIRHYDVTGKNCPAWAVEDLAKWLEIQTEINKLFYKEDEEMKPTEENYQVFKDFMNRYAEEKAQENPVWTMPFMEWAKKQNLINDGKPAASLTRGELATVLFRFSEKLKEGSL